MHSHSHGHSHGSINEDADWLTNLGAVGEGIEGAANFFFGATVYNTLYEIINGHENEDRFGWPLYIGIVLGVISLGSAYTHRALDTYHQAVRHDDHCIHDKDEKHVKHDNHDSHVELSSLHPSLKEPFNPESSDIEAQESKQPLPPPKLNGIQRVSLFGDGASHIFARAGLFTGIVDGITSTLVNTTLPAPTRGCIQLFSTFFGVATQASSIRTCWNTMLDQNQQKAASEQSSKKCSIKH